MLFCAVNGQQQDVIKVSDRGLAFGDGLFTTAKIVDGKIQLLRYHLDRLISGCQQLHIKGVNFNTLAESVCQQAKQYPLATLKIIITAGESERGYARDDSAKPTVIVTISEFPKQYINSDNLALSVGIATAQLGINPTLAGIKHLNRLEQVLVKKEAQSSAFDDLLVTNISGHIIETTMANVFFKRKDKVVTPKLNQSGVNGLVRQRLLALNENIEEVELTLEDIQTIEGAMVCNCLLGIVPIKQLNDKILDTSWVVPLQQELEKDIVLHD
ncbi:aminodeoxychorismate lyase [Thalassotalea agarivorans]|uniref:Aminodeoxychorismate lyase n=1 Tax=Thalassotalea agarivorans TaxID=349064 RepID=A0A1I0EV30_THASX|nr:aminodeoxychorismate lyase [Thalassotalea agarivorans]SET48994.1 4-amino-4-deoxychorismate lyase [Thalassotalea agarivorans]